MEAGKSAPSPKPFDAFIVSGWHLKSYWQAVRACRRARIPVLVRGDSQLLMPRSRVKSWIKKIGYRVMLLQFDGFLVVGQRNREYLAYYGVWPDKMFFSPHFVDNEIFRQKAEKLKCQKAEIRRRWRIPEDAFCALFCGKFISKKRPLDLVEAARLLVQGQRIPQLHLLFVGSGELGVQLRANCHVVFDAENASLSVSDGWRVGGRCASEPSSISNLPSPACALPPASFAGFLNQSELPAAYVAADVLVLPSDGGETWGLVVNEAMACDTPAIVSNAAGCAPDLIDNGKTGFIFASGNCRELALRLTQMAEMHRSNFDFLPALAGKAGNYSVSAAVRGTLQALKALSAK